MTSRPLTRELQMLFKRTVLIIVAVTLLSSAVQAEPIQAGTATYAYDNSFITAIVYADLFRNVAQAPAYSFGIADNFILEFDGAGDFNLDGEYGCEDVDALVAEIASSGNSTTFDLNADGLVDRDDLDLWLMLGGAANLPGNKSYQFGDGNLDGRVDVGDFNVWNGNKFQDVPAWCSGDFNADGVVDISDFNTWNANKFTSADTNTVPEPSSRLVLMVLLSQLGIRSRRTKGKLG
jgi:hypothetical protein